MATVNLRDALRRLRERLDFTQEQMARFLNMSTRSVARWETEAGSLPLWQLMRLRLMAVWSDDESLVGSFDQLMLASGLDESFIEGLLRNARELELVKTLLGHMRAQDPEIEPVLREIQKLIDEDRAYEARRKAVGL
jgi:transcriptional regulator with XRE-family HTH domain